MSSTTWNGSSSTDWATGANWSTGSVPTTGAHVVIPDTSSINNCVLDQTRTIGSLTIQANGTLVGGGFTLNITSEGDASGGTEHFAVNNDGIISGELNLNITTAATTSCDFAGSTGKFHDVTINHASCQVNLESTTQFTGDLTITLGKMVCGGNTVEITGVTSIGPASGSADQATLQCDASAMFLGSGLTSSHALIVNQGGTFTGGSGNHTIGSIDVKNNSNAKCTLTSANTTVDSEKTGDDRNIVIAGSSTFAHSSGTIIITFAGTTHYDIDKTINNLTLNHASLVQKLSDSSNIAGNLTITTGEFNANGRNLEVAGKTSVNGGTLTCSSGTMSFGASYTADYALEITGGTFVGGSGTHTLGSLYMSNTSAAVCTFTSGVTTISSEVTSANEAIKITGTNAVFNHGSGTVTHTTTANTQYVRTGGTLTLNNFIQNNNSNLQVSPSLTCAGTFTLTAGEFDTSGSSYAVTVTGDAAINGGQFVGNASAISFGSLTIASGGTYSATSGTTTITSEAGSGYAIEISGTYTPNAGTLKITTDANTLVKILDDVNHLIIEAATATRVYEWVNNTTVQGNLTINAGRFAHYSPNFSLDVQGDCTINNTGILDGGSGSIEMNSLTIGTGGEYRATTGTTTITGESGGGLAINNDGILTHNKGTVKVDMDSTTSLDLTGTGSVDFYNLIVDSDATVSYGASVIENNLTKKGAGRMRPNGDSGRNLEVKGTLLVEAGTFGRGANDTHTNTFGNVVITGGTIDLTGGGGSGKTIVKGAFRNLGGTVNSP